VPTLRRRAMTYVVRLDGALLDNVTWRRGFVHRVDAEQHAQFASVIAYPGRILTVHDGDASTEGSVVAVFRDGVRVGPAHEDNGY
jgi:hypothetical protein